jgi:hypothetical protein
VTGVRGKKIGEIRKRWGKEVWRKEGRGKKRGVGFLKWAGTGFAGGERRFPAYLGNLRERRRERRKDGLQIVV